MRIRFTLPVPPFSINRMYYRDQRIKTREAREWTQQVFRYIHLTDIEERFDALREEQKRTGACYGVRLVANYPRYTFYNKQGKLSSRTMDVSNFEKPLIDLLFLPKYFNMPSPEGCRNLNSDDKLITALISQKRAVEAEEPSISVSIWLRKPAKI